MCGIFGYYKSFTINHALLKHRGRDDFNQVELNDFVVGHYLHAMVGSVKQPIKRKGMLTANCEIYNWKYINDKYNFQTDNDAETLLCLLDLLFDNNTNIPDIFQTLRNELDGVYAFAYHYDDKVYLFRDVLGVKPLFYSAQGFASEGKVLENAKELHPRHLIVMNIVKKSFDDYYLAWNPLTNETDGNETNENDVAINELYDLVCHALEKRTRGYDKVAILFSGGMDSTLIALCLKRMGKEVIGYVAGFENSKDVIRAKQMAEVIGINLVPAIIHDLEPVLEKVIYAIESFDPMKVGVGVPIYLASKKAHDDGFKMIITGAGADDLFCGYEKQLKVKEYGHDLNRESLSNLRTLFERDLYRDDTVTMINSVEARVPMLDIKLVKTLINYSADKKLEDGKKTLVRLILNYIENEGGPHVEPIRLAAQYGSGVNNEIERLRKVNGYSSKVEYLKTFYEFNYDNSEQSSALDQSTSYCRYNLNLGALFSGGKDSGLALWMMMNRGYNINCLISLFSSNKDSYMFHVPKIEEVPALAKRANIPLVKQTTHGEKEKELDDLENAISKAIKKYNIQGIVAGSIASVYQRNRVEEITEKLGMKVYLPLWYMSQEQVLKLLFYYGFKVQIIHPSAQGMDEFEGQVLTCDHIEKFKKLNINIAGEGGEYESLILSAPFLK